MKKSQYNIGTNVTTQKFNDVLSRVISKIEKNHRSCSDLILASWPRIVGQKIAKMTHPISFDEAVLTVKVQNSTLYSLLSYKEKFWILKDLRKKFPTVEINNIIFRMG